MNINWAIKKKTFLNNSFQIGFAIIIISNFTYDWIIKVLKNCHTDLFPAVLFIIMLMAWGDQINL